MLHRLPKMECIECGIQYKRALLLAATAISIFTIIDILDASIRYCLESTQDSTMYIKYASDYC